MLISLALPVALRKGLEDTGRTYSSVLARNAYRLATVTARLPVSTRPTSELHSRSLLRGWRVCHLGPGSDDVNLHLTRRVPTYVDHFPRAENQAGIVVSAVGGGKNA